MEGLKIRIKQKLFYRTGSPVEVWVIIKNPTKQDYYVNIANTPFEDIETNCFVVKRAGKQIAYDGARMKRKSVGEDTMLLPAGAVRTVVYDLTKIYDLNEPGRYTIRLRPEFIRCYTQINNRRKCQLLKSPEKSFFIRRGDELSVTNGERARIREQLQRNMLNADVTQEDMPVIIDENNNENEEQKQEFKKSVRQAHTQMLDYLDHSIKEMSIMSDTDNSEHYQMVFGKYRKENKDRALEVMTKVQEAMKKDTSLVYKRNTDSNYEDINLCAYIYPGTKTVYLCPGFLADKLTGEDSKMGTLFHEWTHVFGNTEDVEYGGVQMYGRERCRMLAEKDELIANMDERAVNNADSYEFFLETQFLNWGEEAILEGCNDFDDTVGGGPAVVYYEKKLYVFYRCEDGKLKYAVSTKEGDKEIKILTDQKGTAIESASQPEVVVFEDKLYLFYIKKDGLRLFYTKKKGDQWIEEIPVLVNESALFVQQVPQPVVFNNSIYLIYRKAYDMQFYVMSGSGEWDGWSKEQRLDNQTGLVQKPTCNPAVAVYNNKLYIFYQIQAEKIDDQNQIFCEIYNDAMKVCNKPKKITELSDLKLHTTDGMRAVVVGDCVYLVVRDTDRDLVQIRMHIPSTESKELFFTDGEKLCENYLEQDKPNSDSRGSIAVGEDENYLFYVSSLDRGIAFSVQKNGGK